MLNIYPEFNGHGKEVHASSLSNGFAAWYTRKIDEGWGNDILGATGGLEHALGKSVIAKLVLDDSHKP